MEKFFVSRPIFAIVLRGLEGVPGLPGAPQDEAGLHEEIRDEPREWGHMPNAPDSPVRP